MRILICFLLLFLSSSPVVADSWAPAKLKAQISDNGRYIVRVAPGESLGDVYGFAGAKKGKYAKAEYFKFTSDGYRKFREFKLLNPVSPLYIAITNKGGLVTLDNWHNMGYGDVIVVYKPNGKVVKKYSLIDVYTEIQLNRMKMTTSSLWWRCETIPPFFEEHTNTLVVNDVLGGLLKVDLITGAKDYAIKGGNCNDKND